MQDDVKSLLDQSGANALLKADERILRPTTIPIPDPEGLTFDLGTKASPDALLAERAEFEAAAAQQRTQQHEPTPVPRVTVPIVEAPPHDLVVPGLKEAHEECGTYPMPASSPEAVAFKERLIEAATPERAEDLGDDLPDDSDEPLDVLLAADLRAVDPQKLETVTLGVLEWLGKQVPRVIRTWYRKRLYGGIGLSMTACKSSVQAAVDQAVIAVRDDLDFIQGHTRLLLTLHRTWSASAIGQQIFIAAALAEFCRIAQLGETAESPPV